LLPQDLAGEAQVLRWSVAALNTIEVPVLSLWFVNISGGKGTKPSEALYSWADMRLEQLDGWLADRQFIATDAFTVADNLMTHVLGGGTDPELLKPYTNILAYRARCTDRPAWKKTLDAYSDRCDLARSPWWHYDVLRALDYLRSAGVAPDERVAEAVALVAL
jgi:glutathione S-transferase